jgi:hypothetical protein
VVEVNAGVCRLYPCPAQPSAVGVGYSRDVEEDSAQQLVHTRLEYIIVLEEDKTA